MSAELEGMSGTSSPGGPHAAPSRPVVLAAARRYVLAWLRGAEPATPAGRAFAWLLVATALSLVLAAGADRVAMSVSWRVIRVLGELLWAAFPELPFALLALAAVRRVARTRAVEEGGLATLRLAQPSWPSAPPVPPEPAESRVGDARPATPDDGVRTAGGTSTTGSAPNPHDRSAEGQADDGPAADGLEAEATWLKAHWRAKADQSPSPTAASANGHR